MILSKEQACLLASALRPQIREYVDENRQKYELWLQSELDMGSMTEAQGNKSIVKESDIQNEYK